MPLQSGYDRAFRTETRTLLRQELRDRRELQHLRRRLRNFGDVPFWGLLIELIRLDTEKHISILRFLEDDNRRDGMAGMLARARVRWRLFWSV